MLRTGAFIVALAFSSHAFANEIIINDKLKRLKQHLYAFADEIIIKGKLKHHKKLYYNVDNYVACKEKEQFFLEKYKRHAPVNMPYYSVKDGKLKIALGSKTNPDEVKFKSVNSGSCQEYSLDKSKISDESYYNSVVRIRAYDIWPDSKEGDMRRLAVPDNSKYAKIKPFMKSRWTAKKIKLALKYPSGFKPEYDEINLGDFKVMVRFK